MAAIDEIMKKLEESFARQRMLGLACGDGYWTDELTAFADYVLATDINPSLF